MLLAGRERLPDVSVAPARSYPLESTDGLRPHNVTATAVTYEGKRGVRLVVSDSARRSVVLRPTLGDLADIRVMVVDDQSPFRVAAEAVVRRGRGRGA